MRKTTFLRDNYPEVLNDWQRIEEVMLYYRFFSVTAFGRELGISDPGRLFRIRQGHNRISVALAELITARFPEIRIGWLLTGLGQMLESCDN